MMVMVIMMVMVRVGVVISWTLVCIIAPHDGVSLQPTIPNNTQQYPTIHNLTMQRHSLTNNTPTIPQYPHSIPQPTNNTKLYPNSTR